jgi:hypothetical protein
MTNDWSNETPEEGESRLAMAACLNADVIFLGVRAGLCYFEVRLTEEGDAEEEDGESVILSISTNGITAERVSSRAAEADGGWRNRNKLSVDDVDWLETLRISADEKRKRR